MYPTLTEVPCDCCGETLIDPVGLVIVCDAVRAYRIGVENRQHDEAAAWREAHEKAAAAMEAARAARGSSS